MHCAPHRMWPMRIVHVVMAPLPTLFYACMRRVCVCDVVPVCTGQSWKLFNKDLFGISFACSCPLWPGHGKKLFEPMLEQSFCVQGFVREWPHTERTVSQATWVPVYLPVPPFPTVVTEAGRRRVSAGGGQSRTALHAANTRQD